MQGEEFISRHIILEDHKIAHISEHQVPCDDVIDIKGKIVIPGCIDPHVHFREPGLTSKEDFLSGSKAAAKGGITTFFDMPNVIPPTTTVALLEERRELAKKSIVNYGFHFGTSLDNIEEVKKVTNVPSCKIYMNTTTGNLKMDDLKAISQVMEAVPLCAFHAENESLGKVLDIAVCLKKKVYECHTSTAFEVHLIKKNKSKVYMEVSPHHLFLTAEDGEKLGMLKHVKPSLKTKEDQEALWKAMDSGLVDTVGTDHAPHLRQEKMEKETYGFPGVETMLPLLLDAVNTEKLTLSKVIELTSKNPAKIFRIKNKGLLEEGYDADLTVLDMELEKAVSKEDLVSKSGWSPFEGKVLKGWPIATFVNGNLVWDQEGFHEGKGKEVTILPPKKVFPGKKVQEEETGAEEKKVPEEHQDG